MVAGITAQELGSYYPRLYHVAALGSWANIHRYGLLSTRGLLRLFKIPMTDRRPILEEHRPESIVIKHAVIGRATIRDQKPMDDAGLRRALYGGLMPTHWYRRLNGMVFFWLARERVDTFLGARAYRDSSHVLLTIDTAPLLAQYRARVLLSPLNSGCTKPFPHPRGPDTFQPLSMYPFESYRRKRGIRDAIVELAIPGGVRNIRDFVLRVDEMKADARAKLIWRP